MTVVLNIAVSGIDDTLKELKNLKDVFSNKSISDKITEHIKELAIKFCPRSNIKHKHLDESIYIRKLGETYQLIADKPYASYVEYGTKFIPVGSVVSPMFYISSGGKFSSRPFLRPAIYRGLRDAQKIVNDIIEKIKRGK